MRFAYDERTLHVTDPASITMVHIIMMTLMYHEGVFRSNAYITSVALDDDDIYFVQMNRKDRTHTMLYIKGKNENYQTIAVEGTGSIRMSHADRNTCRTVESVYRMIRDDRVRGS